MRFVEHERCGIRVNMCSEARNIALYIANIWSNTSKRMSFFVSVLITVLLNSVTSLRSLVLRFVSFFLPAFGKLTDYVVYKYYASVLFKYACLFLLFIYLFFFCDRGNVSDPVG
jgi:hypothetical protein